MAGFIKRIFSHFGLFKDDRHGHGHGHSSSSTAEESSQSPGFTIKVAVPRDSTRDVGPVVSECTSGAGGVQGLRWYAEKLMVDEDGDVAQEFLDEVVPGGSQRNGSIFKVKLQSRPAKLRGPLCTRNGNVLQSIDPSSG